MFYSGPSVKTEKYSQWKYKKIFQTPKGTDFNIPIDFERRGISVQFLRIGIINNQVKLELLFIYQNGKRSGSIDWLLKEMKLTILIFIINSIFGHRHHRHGLHHIKNRDKKRLAHDPAHRPKEPELEPTTTTTTETSTTTSTTTTTTTTTTTSTTTTSGITLKSIIITY